LRIALAQIDPTIGDFAGNRSKIVSYAEAALGLRGGPSSHKEISGGPCDIVVFPELCLCGYPPMDLLDQEAFAEENQKSLRRLQKELPPGIACLVGFVDRNRERAGKPLSNSCAVIKDGEILFSQEKTLLPTYDVFDEARYFESASRRKAFKFRGETIGIAICEDLWWDELASPGMRYPIDPVRELLDLGVTMILSPSASPYYSGKLLVRTGLVSRIARTGKVPLVYVNAAGANDSLIFDGRSFAVRDDGRPAVLAGFDEELLVFDTEAEAAGVEVPTDPWIEMEEALVRGIRGYMRKCGFARAHLGLSGGIDSSLVAVLAAKAIGPSNLTCLSLPSRFSSDHSRTDAFALARNLGARCEILPIEEPFKAFLSLLAPAFGDGAFGLTEENLQARIRGTLLMAYSNKFGSMLLTTGNKSELATGYCTLYGDMCGALAVIGDLLKREVYALARSINERESLIPVSVLEKPPSAELRPNQVDQDSLPPYDDLDKVLDLYIVKNLGKEEIVERGYDSALVHRVIDMVAKAEYKRRQAPPVLKVSPRAFGMGRRMPIARGIYES
jgi:NAD+ synthase (glutamine-hydrolysing)